MKDNYFDTGVNKSQTFEYATATCFAAAVAVRDGARSVRPGRRLQQPSSHSDQRPRHHVAQLRGLLPDPDGQRRRQHQFKGGFGISHATNDVELAYPNQGYVSVFWNQTFISDVPGVGAGTRRLRLLHDRRYRHDRNDRRQHPELLRAGQLDRQLAADAEPGSSHGERGHSVVPPGHRRESACTSAGVRRSLRASASRTTCSATTVSRSPDRTVATTTGRSTSLRAAPSVVTSGRRGIARSTIQTSRS